MAGGQKDTDNTKKPNSKRTTKAHRVRKVRVREGKGMCTAKYGRVGFYRYTKKNTPDVQLWRVFIQSFDHTHTLGRQQEEKGPEGWRVPGCDRK